MTYEGLNRHCFGCKRISHDIYSCLDLSSEEREQKIKEFWELNAAGAQSLSYQAMTGPVGNFRSNVPTNKRPRSPNGDASQRSPMRAGLLGQSRGEKRHKESESYWTAKANSGREVPPQLMERRRMERDERYPHHQGKTTVWNRLEDRLGGRDSRKSTDYNSRPKQTSRDCQERQRGREPYRPRERYYSHQSQASQQAWRPRAQRNEGKSCSPSRTVTNPKYQNAPTPEKADSQQTISGGIQVRNGLDGQGSGVLVVHKNETSEERLRRLKGKSIMCEDLSAKSPSSVSRQAQHAILTRDRGTVVIRERGIHSPPPALRSAPPPLRLRDETEEPSLDLDNLMNSKHIDDMVLTREEEAEVDKLVDELGDVDMDEDMVQNDDLLIDEPGYDAEIIDAISQLSPANAVNEEIGATAGMEKEPQPTTTNQMKNKSAVPAKIPHAVSGQSRAGADHNCPSLR
ncbi:hypothetical protein IGI04_022646 [Brassica rapa subsp. trilocularis]|uniref:Zinc knuckle CX2CX4HX4C domain-containing protein n=1 Tax=Brassica rapa subsp. trilocularis TaxID=1813537 RepID=A0ABQ7M3U6_BRACM|nr:hypothetical protein IGI04_022646 [Brassica rapa subsp. trilocularis]